MVVISTPIRSELQKYQRLIIHDDLLQAHVAIKTSAELAKKLYDSNPRLPIYETEFDDIIPAVPANYSRISSLDPGIS